MRDDTGDEKGSLDQTGLRGHVLSFKSPSDDLSIIVRRCLGVEDAGRHFPVPVEKQDVSERDTNEADSFPHVS